MATWVYDYEAGPTAGPFTNLLDFCDEVLTASEGDAPKRGGNISIPYRDGVYSDPLKFRDNKIVFLDCMVSYTDAAGLVTHPDGSAGHIYENLQSLKKLLGGDGAEVTLRVDKPHMGALEAPVEYLGGIEAGGPRMRWIFPMQLLEGAWREQAASTDAENGISSFPHAYTILTGGDTDVGDATITMECTADGDNPKLTIDTPDDELSASGSFSSGDILIANLRTSTFTLNGLSTAVFRRNRAWYMRFPNDQAALGLTFDADSGIWDVDIDWNNRWL